MGELKRLEDLVLQLDATFADLSAAQRKGYLTRDLKLLRERADAIHKRRRTNDPDATRRGQGD